MPSVGGTGRKTRLRGAGQAAVRGSRRSRPAAGAAWPPTVRWACCWPRRASASWCMTGATPAPPRSVFPAIRRATSRPRTCWRLLKALGTGPAYVAGCSSGSRLSLSAGAAPSRGGEGTSLWRVDRRGVRGQAAGLQLLRAVHRRGRAGRHSRRRQDRALRRDDRGQSRTTGRSSTDVGAEAFLARDAPLADGLPQRQRPSGRRAHAGRDAQPHLPTLIVPGNTAPIRAPPARRRIACCPTASTAR